MVAQKSLWGEEFDVNSSSQDKKNLAKLKNIGIDPNKLIKSKKLSLEDRLFLIEENVKKVLGVHLNDTLVITSKQVLIDYIDKSLSNGIIAIDTETNNSLDPLTCKLMGPCIYTPGLKQAYIPLNHVNPFTNERLKDQLTEDDIAEQFSRLVNSDIKILMHNGKFDYKVIKCTCGVELPIYWDTMVAARMLDENEPSAGLKQQYIDKINPEQEKYSIDHLFENVLYEQVDPTIFSLYAATDAMMTYQLYQWQVEKFKDPDLQGVFNVFKNIEMPLIKVVAEMELTGIEIDLEYADRLSKKYHKLLDECNKEIQKEIIKIQPFINNWRLTPDANKRDPSKPTSKSKSEKLEVPINLESPIQLSILLYDILKMPQVSKDKPRGTGVDELTSLVNKTNSKLCELILKQRGLNKLVNTFIDKLPKDINSKTGKIHCQFNATGTDTGRFSSSNPNMQQIPRSNLEIKPMFKAPNGYSLVLCDLSAAEVRTSANASGDSDMLRAYKEGQDLYSLIASKIYNNNYEDNLEFYPEGTKIIFEGKEIICGNEKEYFIEDKNNTFEVPKYYYVNTIQGMVEAISLKKGDTLITDGGNQFIKEIFDKGEMLLIKI